jgi:single-strand DNA-binding protein
MSTGVNTVTLIGNLGQAPELRSTQSGLKVANFSVATNENWVGKTGDKQTRTEWHRVVVWGKLAETCSQYLSKGRQVHVEGTLRTRTFTTAEGTERTVTEVHASKVTFLGNATQKTVAAELVGVADEFTTSVDDELEQVLQS